jgi:hypothetical protein
MTGFLDPGSARVTPVHKRFMVVAKLFDELIEPEFYERGIELYDYAGHLALANLLYRRGPVACGADRWERLLSAYVAMTRDSTDQRISAFLRALNTCRITAGVLDVRKLLDVIDVAHVRWAVSHGRDNGSAVPTLDPAVPSLVENCNWWEERVGRFVVEHDDAPGGQSGDDGFPPPSASTERREPQLLLALKEEIFGEGFCLRFVDVDRGEAVDRL